MAKRSIGYGFELWQDGMVVAEVEAGNFDDAYGEILHYAKVYAQDGPVEIRGVNEGTRVALKARAEQRAPGSPVGR